MRKKKKKDYAVLKLLLIIVLCSAVSTASFMSMNYYYNYLKDKEYKEKYINFDKTSFTEEEVVKAIKNNQLDQFEVGDTITLSNSYCSAFIVIGKDRDGTTGTIDIMPVTQVNNMKFEGDTYASSNIREWINGTYIDSFTNDIIRESFKSMMVECATEIDSGVLLKDKAKLLSVAEINIITFNTYMPGYDNDYREGSAYDSIFNPSAYVYNIEARWIDNGKYGSEDGYWLRTPRLNVKGNNCWIISSDGSCDSANDDERYGVVPVLRL
jgi:hypothetical protein